MKKTKKITSPLTSQRAKPSDVATAKQLLDQYAIVVAAERASFRERVKFGAMLILWEQYLGESRGGRGTDGDGLKGWLEKNCPEIAYATAMEYKIYAERALAMLGGGWMATAALLGQSEVVRPDGETVDVNDDTRKRCDKLFEDAISRRKLEQMYFDFMKKETAKEKRRKWMKQAGGGDATLPKPSKAEAAERVWAGIMVQLGKAAAYDTIALLRPKYAAACYERMEQLTAAMKAQMKVEE